MPSITVDELQKIVGGQKTTPQAQKSAAAPMSAPPSAPTGAKLRPELVQSGQRFPALQPYLSNVVVQPGKNKKSDDRQVEFYPPWESENPNPGKLTVETYHPELTSGEGLTNTVSGELLHYIGGVNPATGKPVDPNYYSLKQKVSAARTPQQQVGIERKPSTIEVIAMGLNRGAGGSHGPPGGPKPPGGGAYPGCCMPR